MYVFFLFEYAPPYCSTWLGYSFIWYNLKDNLCTGKRKYSSSSFTALHNEDWCPPRGLDPWVPCWNLVFDLLTLWEWVAVPWILLDSSTKKLPGNDGWKIRKHSPAFATDFQWLSLLILFALVAVLILPRDVDARDCPGGMWSCKDEAWCISDDQVCTGPQRTGHSNTHTHADVPTTSWTVDDSHAHTNAHPKMQAHSHSPHNWRMLPGNELGFVSTDTVCKDCCMMTCPCGIWQSAHQTHTTPPTHTNTHTHTHTHNVSRHAHNLSCQPSEQSRLIWVILVGFVTNLWRSR